METKVRQHRKYLKQNDFLKRQAAKEREANAKVGDEIHKPEINMPVPEDPGTPERDISVNMDHPLPGNPRLYSRKRHSLTIFKE